MELFIFATLVVALYKLLRSVAEDVVEDITRFWNHGTSLFRAVPGIVILLWLVFSSIILTGIVLDGLFGYAETSNF